MPGVFSNRILLCIFLRELRMTNDHQKTSTKIPTTSICVKFFPQISVGSDYLEFVAGECETKLLEDGWHFSHQINYPLKTKEYAMIIDGWFRWFIPFFLRWSPFYKDIRSFSGRVDIFAWGKKWFSGSVLLVFIHFVSRLQICPLYMFGNNPPQMVPSWIKYCNN